MRSFLVCVHDATPAFAAETHALLRDLAPLVGRRISLGVVPDWHGKWPLDAYPSYSQMIRERAEEFLLHGYFHQRRIGRGPVSVLTDGSDEMNGLDADGTRLTLERGQRAFVEAFGSAARGFLAPGWQRGHVRPDTAGLDYTVGFFSLESRNGRNIPLATWTWDCGRWPWLGHIGHGLGRVSQFLDRGVPTLAIHPRDLERGFWPGVLRQIEELLAAGYTPATTAGLLDAEDAA